MGALIGKRLGAMVVILLVLVAVLFYLQQISPLDPVHAMLGGQASADAVAQQRHALGLDQPVLQQFWDYLRGLVTGDLGTSYRTRRPVSTDLGDYAPATLELALSGLLIAVVLGSLFAFATTLRWPGAAVFRLILMLGSSTPAFLLGIGGILIFYLSLGWLPANGRTSIADAPDGPTGLLTVDGLIHGQLNVVWDAMQHLAMPALASRSALPSRSDGCCTRACPVTSAATTPAPPAPRASASFGSSASTCSATRSVPPCR